MCLNEEDAILKSMLQHLQHSTSLVSALSDQLLANSEKVVTEEVELVLCQRLSSINNMASVETDGSSTELEVRYATNRRKYSVCHSVYEINFV